LKPAPPLTQPLGFHFATDDRLKVHEMETRLDTAMSKEVNFEHELRHYAALPATKQHTTQPLPFNLQTERKRKFSEGDQPSGKFESVAEKVIKFCTQTPERFRRRKSPACDSSLDRHHGDGRQTLTVPKTPNLETRNRSRPTAVMSQAEREELELEECKKNQFHANPVNPKVLTNSMIGIKKVVPKECTTVEEFHMETEQRLRQRKAQEVVEPEEPVYEFRARPVPKAVLEGPVGIHAVQPAPLTVPQSPAFSTRRAVNNVSKDQKDQDEVEVVHFKTRPVPHVGIPFVPRFDHHATEPVPFSFSERDKELFARKEEKIQKVYEEERKAREFHAQPMKDLTPKLPPKKPIPLTEPEPFDLEVDARGQAKAEEKKKQLEEERQKLKKLATFKARPPTVLSKEPYVPQKSNKPLTEILDLQLNTERRAESRLEFEKWRHEKEMEAVEERVARERQREIDEMNEIKRQRAENVHRANPVRHYRPVEVVPSSQPLTLPQSPRFSERLRTRSDIRN